MFKVNVPREVTDRQVADALCSAFEHGSKRWIESYDHLPYVEPKDTDHSLELDLPIFLRAGGVSFFLSAGHVQRGLELFAELNTELFDYTFPANDEDYWGAPEYADAFLQLCLFGEIRFKEGA